MRRAPRIASLLIAAALAPNAARGVSLPPGFSLEDVAPGQYFQSATGFCFTPSGRIFVCEQAGRVWAVTNGAKGAHPLLDLSAEVLDNGTRGLLGIAVDPQFAVNRSLYLFYAVDPDSNGVDDEDDGFSRLTRFQLSATDSDRIDPESRFVLLGRTWRDGWADGSDSHSECALRFGRDGTLLVGHGDGAQAGLADPGGYDPGLFEPGRCDPGEDVGAFRAQYLASLDGKILRLDPATGDGLQGNPFWDGDPKSNRSRVWASGLRNPFRFCLRPGTGSTDPALADPGTLVIGDVGWVEWEELDVARAGGVNFGWPCFDGAGDNPPYQQSTPPANGGCATIGTPDNPSPPTPPVAVWDHYDSSLAQPPESHEISTCLIGGAFAQGSGYPPPYSGAYFFGDFVQGWIQCATLDADDHLVSVAPFAHDADAPVDFETDPGTGEIVYLSISTGALRRIRYTPPPDRPPVAVLRADPIAGIAPLDVHADAGGSSDPDGDSLAFHWSFGDGALATGATVTHHYGQPGTYALALVADDERGASTGDSVRVIVTPTAAFPTTPVLDDFARADGALGASWADSAAAYAIAGGEVAPSSGSPAAWNAPFGEDQEAFLTWIGADAASSVELTLKAQGPDPSDARVRVRWDAAVGSVAVATLATDSGWVERGRLPMPAQLARERVGARAYSNGVVAVFQGDSLLGQVSVGRWPFRLEDGLVGFAFTGSGSGRIDDFGGGDASLVFGPPPLVTIESPADSSFYVAGDRIALRASASSSSTPPESLAWAWSVIQEQPRRMRHDLLLLTTAPDTEYVAQAVPDSARTYLRVRVMLTDTDHRTTARSVRIFPQVDLRPSGLAVRPDTVGTASAAEFSFWMHDDGAMPSPLSRWRVSAGDSIVAQGFTLAAAHDSVLVRVRALPRVGAGNTSLTVALDPLGRVVETDETNNAFARPLVVVAGEVRDVLPPLFAVEPSVVLGGPDAWLSWRTDEPSIATVRWGPTRALEDSTADTTLALAHTLRLNEASGDARFVQVVARDAAGNASFSPVDSVVDRAGELLGAVPRAVALSAARPNPSRDAVWFDVELPAASEVRLDVYDVAGRLVGRAPVRVLSAGRHALAWPVDGVAAPSAPGLYLARVRIGDREHVRRFVRLR